jgi:alkanesulfonate monooxygenase SsuD/methylene tetrahydromethanopterin reductase-like flavin-dependent oxidoreductase (luciferase family)
MTIQPPPKINNQPGIPMKLLWRDEVSEYHGRYVSFLPVRCFPTPARKPHPPILIGSISSPNAFRRVAEWGDGWLPAVSSVAQFAEGVSRIKTMAKEFGRNPDSFDSPCLAWNRNG